MQKRLWVVAVLTLVAVSCGSNNKQPPHVETRTERIVGGETFAGLPAVGALVYNGRHHCTGTLIGPRKVLTAGHCVSGYSASRMRFVLGESIFSPSAVLAVSRLEPHPAYSGVRNDIGLVYLASDVANVASMRVLTEMTQSFVGTELLFVGYGVENGYNNSGSGIKRAVTIPVASVDSSTFSYRGTRNTCGGDSGGPAFYQAADGELYLAGVTSYGDQYCVSYGVDTRVDRYLDFLDLNPQRPPADPCGGETFSGRCDGETVIWCESQTIYRQDCSDSNRVCQFDPTKNYYGCATPAAPVDPCDGETFEGRCSGDTVIWCEDEKVQQVDCSQRGRSCGFSSSAGYYGCIAQ
jgi:secreted trypsin-like serine protease